jgi:Tol biopolymer transport system component
VETPEEATLVQFSREGAGVTYVVREGDTDNLWYQAFAGGAPRQLTHFTSDHIYAYSFSRDGKRLAFTRGNEKQDAVMLASFR